MRIAAAATTAAMLVVGLAPRAARADEDFLTVGVGGLAGWTWYEKSVPRAIDLGMEATLVRTRKFRHPFEALINPSYGLFLQIAGVGVGAGDDPEGTTAVWHLRTAAGAQGGYGPLGLEAGFAYESGDDLRLGGLYTHAAAYFSVGGLGSWAVRLGMPFLDIGDNRPDGYGWELAITFSVKALIMVQPGRTRLLLPFVGTLADE